MYSIKFQILVEWFELFQEEDIINGAYIRFYHRWHIAFIKLTSVQIKLCLNKFTYASKLVIYEKIV